MNFYLSRFNSIRPKYELSQSDALACLIKLRLNLKPFPEGWDAETIEKRINRFGLASAQIARRGIEIGDYLPGGQKMNLFEGGKIPNLTSRMGFFKARAEQVMEQFYHEETPKPQNLIHVSCTGYIAPSAAQIIAAKWHESESTNVTHAYHMGCYASLPAIRIARGFQAASMAKHHHVDIVHQEICSLHFDPSSLEAEQIVVQSLFADGHIRYTMSDELGQDSLQILALREQLIPDTTEMMSWIPSSTHFAMHLGREVPAKIKNVLRHFVDSILTDCQIDESAEIIFAIHPGGPKIIEAVEKELSLNAEQTSESHDILKNFGNMSSATLPHIWEAILKNQNRKSGAIVISLAFGPGLTMSGSAFKLCRR